MFEHLITDDNRITVLQLVRNKDHDVVGHICIGNGYGVFRSQSLEEVAAYPTGKFDNVGLLVHYEPMYNQKTVVDGVTYPQTHTVPDIGDVCVWRGTPYSVTGVDVRIDIQGDLVGYTIRCSGGS
jgi:hypothetical protein